MLKIASLMFLLSGTGLASTQDTIQFKRIDSRSGLSHNSVFSILQDRQGYLWFGTHDGLNRYDGYEFVVYRHQPGDSTSLSGNNISAMVQDSTGALWIGSRDGLSRYDPGTNAFKRYRPAVSSNFVITSLAMDAHAHLWLRVVSDSAVYRFRPQTSTFDRFPLMVPGHDVTSVGVDKEGQAWATSTSAQQPMGIMVHRLDSTQQRFEPLALPGQYFATDTGISSLLHAGSSGKVWVAAWDQGWSPEARQVLQAIPPLKDKVTVLFEERAGYLWVGTDNGLYRYDPVKGTLQHVLLEPSGTSWIANYVRAIYQDAAGTLWVGTNSGLYRYDPHVKPFVFFDPSAYAAALPNASPIMALAMANERLWAGTLGAGLLRIDRENQTTQQYLLTRSGGPASANLVWSIHPEPGALWLGTSAGMARFDVETGQVTWPASPFSGGIFTVRRIPTTNKLLAVGNGVIQIDRFSENIQPLTDPPMLDEGGVIETVVGDEPRRALWLASEAGLFRHDLETKQTYPVPPVHRTLTKAVILSLHLREDGTLWLGTDMGLACFDPETSTLVLFDAADWPGAVVYSILEDHQQRLWLGTSKGLIRFDTETQATLHFDGEDGIGNTEFNRRAALRLPDGRMLFGGLEGITMFDPDAINENPYVPPVVITQVHVSSQNGSVSRRPAPGQSLALTYEDKSFALEYAALSYTNPAKNQYRYRLDGFEDAWVEAGARRRADYTNIPPGTYTFRVQGSNEDGLWNEAGVALPIVIAPPFWQRWWFRLVVLVGLGALLYAGYRYRVRQLLEMERLRLRIAGDLHDDIGSKLSGMALMSEMLEADPQIPTAQKADLAEIGTSAREIVGDLRDIVWFIDPDHDKSGKTVEKMRQTARRLLNGTAHTFDVTDAEGLEETAMGFRRNLFLIYKEALHNVARHAHASHVQIGVRVEGKTLTLTVKDDGVGLVAGKVEVGSGLKNMQRRAREMGGALNVTSEAGQGTHIEVTAPVP